MFVPPDATARIRAHAARDPLVARAVQRFIDDARPHLEASDDELWLRVFAPAIERTWMVWSNGHCPACKAGVPMYSWRCDAIGVPWKVRCPHCAELFPKNDFAAYHRSGIDPRSGVFDFARADRSLLFNSDHPDLADPLHRFGVDDGNGYREGEKLWRFIGFYLVFGQWKQAIVGAVVTLSKAYVATGDARYAHKAGVLLDRVADVYPDFDFSKQGWVYEVRGAAGYVSTWHDSCEETRDLTLAYDRVRPALRNDAELAAFAAAKARQHPAIRPKALAADILRNVEERILRDALLYRTKVRSNFPRPQLLFATILAVLDREAYRPEVEAIVVPIIQRTTAVDGVTGEKGISGYTALTIQTLAEFIAMFERVEPGFLKWILGFQPRLAQTYRFHIDTWIDTNRVRYYPAIGDASSFATRADRYAGVILRSEMDMTPPVYHFLWSMYEATGDAAFVQVLYQANGSKLDGLPYDLFEPEPAEFQRKVAEAIGREGPAPRVGSVNKKQWRLAVLRSGEGEASRAALLDYDTGGPHGHADGMNLGLYANGLDLMPDFGYPPVQFGGWSTARSLWYFQTAAHNTVVVDEQTQTEWVFEPIKAETTLWADGAWLRAVRASGPDLALRHIDGPRQYERTVAMIDVSDRDCYLVDVFRVVGGVDHAKFQHSHFATMTTHGLSLHPSEDFGRDLQMRNFRTDRRASPGWSAEFHIEDRHGYLAAGADVRLSYTDFTSDAEASTCEGWVVSTNYEQNAAEVWIPRLMIRRRSAGGGLASTFVAVIEPHEGRPSLASIRRMPLSSDGEVALEVTLADGRRDVILARDVEDPLERRPAGPLQVPELGITMDGDFCVIRYEGGRPTRLAAHRVRSIHIGERRVEPPRGQDFAELQL